MDVKLFNSLNKNISGYSLVELLIGIAIISGAALIIANFSTSYNSTQTTTRRSCESYTESLINIVKEETPYRQILTTTPSGADALRTPPAFGSGTRAVPNPASYGPVSGSAADTNPFIITGSTFATAQLGERPNSFQMIQGSIRSLATIYNRTPGIRCQFGTYAPITTPGPGNLDLPEFLRSLPGGVTIQMRIDPYIISSGVSLCPNNLTQVFPGPAGILGPASSAFSAGSGNPEPNYRATYDANFQQDSPNTTGGGSFDGSAAAVAAVASPATQQIAHLQTAGPVQVGDPNLGLRMVVQLSYSAGGQNYSCNSSQNFEYPADRSAPAAPNRVRVVPVPQTNPSVVPEALGGVWDHCGKGLAGQADARGSFSLDIGYEGLPIIGPTAAEPGTQFLCKDLSWVRTATTGPIPCFTVPGGIPGAMPAGVPSTPQPGTPQMNTTNNLQYNSSVNSATRVKRWVACDRLKICNVDPAVSVFNSNSPGDKYLRLSYTNLPNGCHANLEVVAVDTAGNRSISTHVGGAGTPQGFLIQPSTTVTVAGMNFATRLNEIYHPACGGSTLGTAAFIPLVWPLSDSDGGRYVPGLGLFCPPQANWDAGVRALVPNGYYTCRGSSNFNGARAGAGPVTRCCVGPNCRPWN